MGKENIMKNWSKIFDIRDGTYESDFRMCNPLDNNKGDTYPDTKMSWTNLIPHESLFDIYDTLNHETYHAALKREEMTDETEHIMIRALCRVLYGLIDLDD